MRVEISAPAAEFIAARGGRLWVWAAHPRVCCTGAPAWMHADVRAPAGLAGFTETETSGVLVRFLAPGGRRPDVLQIGLHGSRRPRVEAYWDGCLMAMP